MNLISLNESTLGKFGFFGDYFFRVSSIPETHTHRDRDQIELILHISLSDELYTLRSILVSFQIKTGKEENTLTIAINNVTFSRIIYVCVGMHACARAH